METTSKFTIGLNAGVVGRTSRLILGGLIPLITIIRELVLAQPSLAFLGMATLYLVVILAAYLAAHYFLGERLFAHANPWIGTAILVAPPSIALMLRLGPVAFQVGLALYISISLIFNFIMSYGGCEVMAIPSLIFRRRYVVYCPWNVVDIAEKAVIEGRARAEQAS